MKQNIPLIHQLIGLYNRSLKKYQRLVQANQNKRKQSILRKRLLKLGKNLLAYKTIIRKTAVAASLASVGLFTNMTQAKAQYFEPEVVNPFGLTPSYINKPTLGDLDNDGDFDMMIGDTIGNLIYYKNSGTISSPAFDAPVTNPFSLTNVYSLSFPAFVDLDNDGDLDLMVGEYYGDFHYFQNTGTASSPSFAGAVTNPFGLANIGYNSIPAFADINNDGDIDMIAGEYYGDFFYFENTGTASSPAFGASVTNPFGLTSIGEYINVPDFADLDGDGDMDAIAGTYSGNFFYFQNNGTAAANFIPLVSNPFNLSNIGYLSFPAFCDLDNDGDFDLMCGEVYGEFHYFENTPALSVNEAENSQLISAYPNPFNETIHVNTQGFVANEIMVKDLTGKTITVFTPTSDKVELSTSTLAKGVYVIQVFTSGNVNTLKITKQ